MGNEKRENGSNGEGVLYGELLDRSHKDGLKEVKTRLVQFPNKENQFTAIVFARVRTNKGIFSGIGDASPANVTPDYAPHFIRVAETRAKARAYRDAVNVATVGVDELGPNHGNGSGNGKSKTVPDKKGQPEKDAKIPEAGKSSSQNTNRTQVPMTERQRSYLFRILAQRGFEGDSAHEELKRQFGVKTLKDVTKQQARDLIDKILKSVEV